MESSFIKKTSCRCRVRVNSCFYIN